MPPYASYCLNAFLLSVVFILVLERLAPQVGLIDVPTSRKAHGRQVPLVGGIAMFGSFALMSVLIDPSLHIPTELTLGLAVLVFVGVLDDRFDLSPWTRLVVQVIAVLIMVLPGWNVVSTIGTVFGQRISLGFIELPFTIIFAVGLINAYNMLDGLDGLAGGSAAASFFWLAVAAGIGGRVEIGITLELMLFATLGFLVFNLRHPWCRQARVFMGDAGSMMLGAGIAWLIANLSGSAEKELPLVALLWTCAVPVIDTLSLIVRRLEAGDNPFVGDRNHLHHLVLEVGASQKKATLIVISLSFLCGGIGVGGIWLGVPDVILAIGLVIPVVLHCVFVAAVYSWRRNPDPSKNEDQPIEAIPHMKGQGA